MSDLNSVVISKKPDSSWQALHVPSERYAFGETAIEAQEQMRSLLGINESGDFEQAKENHQHRHGKTNTHSNDVRSSHPCSTLPPTVLQLMP